MFSPTTLDVAGTLTSVDSSFDPATITDSPKLVDGDLAIINAEPASVTVPAPMIGFGLPVFLAVGGLWFGAKLLEHRRRGARLFMTLTLLAESFMGLILARRLGRRHGSNSIASAAGFGGSFGAIFVSAAILLPGICSAATSVKQNTATAPSTGVAGVSTVNITASGVPSGVAAGNVTIKLAPTCTVGASGPVAGEVDATDNSVKLILGSTDRFNFTLPAALAAGTYMAQLVTGPQSEHLAANLPTGVQDDPGRLGRHLDRSGPQPAPLAE
jgi:hypothetical protein